MITFRKEQPIDGSIMDLTDISWISFFVAAGIILQSLTYLDLFTKQAWKVVGISIVCGVVFGFASNKQDLALRFSSLAFMIGYTGGYIAQADKSVLQVVTIKNVLFLNILFIFYMYDTSPYLMQIDFFRVSYSLIMLIVMATFGITLCFALGVFPMYDSMRTTFYTIYTLISAAVFGLVSYTIYLRIGHQHQLSFITLLTWMTFGMVLFGFLVDYFNLSLLMRCSKLIDNQPIADVFKQKFSEEMFSDTDIIITIVIISVTLICSELVLKNGNYLVLNVAWLASQYVATKHLKIDNFIK